MRLKPAVGGTVRVSDRDVLLAGRYRIPAGTALWTPTYIVHNSRHVWGQDAAVFKPVRRCNTSRDGALAGSSDAFTATVPYVSTWSTTEAAHTGICGELLYLDPGSARCSVCDIFLWCHAHSFAWYDYVGPKFPVASLLHLVANTC